MRIKHSKLKYWFLFSFVDDDEKNDQHKRKLGEKEKQEFSPNFGKWKIYRNIALCCVDNGAEKWQNFCVYSNELKHIQLSTNWIQKLNPQTLLKPLLNFNNKKCLLKDSNYSDKNNDKALCIFFYKLIDRTEDDEVNYIK